MPFQPAGIIALVVFATAVPGPEPAQPTSPASSIAFVDVSVIPMNTAGIQARQTVVVDGGVIVAVGDRRTVKPPSGARLIDGRGSAIPPPASSGAGLAPTSCCWLRTRSRISAPSTGTKESWPPAAGSPPPSWIGSRRSARPRPPVRGETRWTGADSRSECRGAAPLPSCSVSDFGYVDDQVIQRRADGDLRNAR